jgi:hypothetical protein
VLSAMQAIVVSLKVAFKTEKHLSEAQLLGKYDKLCIVVDEVIHEVLRADISRQYMALW